jgi:transcriptional regulator with XRE-family HTH domain
MSISTMAETRPPVRKYLHTLGRLGAVVRERRTALGLGVDELAARANVSPAGIDHMECGRADPDLPGTRRVLDVLGIQPVVLPAELLGGCQ